MSFPHFCFGHGASQVTHKRSRRVAVVSSFAAVDAVDQVSSETWQGNADELHQLEVWLAGVFGNCGDGGD